MRSNLLLPIGLLLPAALQTTAVAQTVRDSAGVRIVQNPARAKAPVLFRLGTSPVLQVGGPDEENTSNEFAPNQGYLRAARLSDGGLAVIDQVRVHFFDPRGKRVKISGRAGAGPEEFRYLTSVCRTRGDTIVVSDSHNDRLAVLAKSGAIVRTIRQDLRGSPPFSGCLDDGTVLLEKYQPAAPGAKRTIQVTRVRLDGTTVNLVGDFPFSPLDMVTQAEPVIVAEGQKVYLGDPTVGDMRVYAPTGKLTSIIRTADPLVRITAAEAEDAMSSTIPNNVSQSERKERMDRMRARGHPATWPAYSRVHVDPAGRLWIQDYNRDRATPDGWTAFDPDGKLIGRLLIPPPAAGARRLEIIAFVADGLLVRRRDEDGFAFLTIFPIETIRR